MYIFKNAFISIKRNKGRNFLLGVIIFVIACATTIALAIRSSADTLIQSYSDKYDVVASISVDREYMRENMGRGPGSNKMEDMSQAFSNDSQITVEDIENYGKSDYVKSYHYTQSLNMNIEGVDKVESSQYFGGKGNIMSPNMDMNQGDFNIMGYSSLDAMQEFISGNYSITEGEINQDFTSSTGSINSEFATLNDISVGDKLVIINPNDEDEKYEIEVSGIFDENTDSSNEMSMFSQSANMIITNVSVVNEILENNDVQAKVTPNFVLNDKDVVEQFIKEVEDKGLSEYLMVSTNQDLIEGATSSISNTKTFATTFLVVIFIIGGVILFVINLVNIKQRKYEIGVLRTIGMKKSFLTAQFTIELLSIAIVCLGLGAFAGASLSVPVSNTLLQQEIQSSQEEMDSIGKNFGGKKMDRRPMNGVTQIQAFDSIDATVDSKVIGQLFVIGIGLTLISSSACMISIQRFSPLTILKERT